MAAQGVTARQQVRAAPEDLQVPAAMGEWEVEVGLSLNITMACLAPMALTAPQATQGPVAKRWLVLSQSQLAQVTLLPERTASAAAAAVQAAQR